MLPFKPIATIYNPLNQTGEELLQSFVVREKEFGIMFSDIKSSDLSHPGQHYMIQGQRGQGKTTLLLKLYYEIKRDKQLKKSLIPLIFNEEQYHIYSLFDLWVYTAEKLQEEDTVFAGLGKTIDELADSPDLEIQAFNTLVLALQKKKKNLVLLIDNIGPLFDKFSRKEQQRFREVLIACRFIRLIGASVLVTEFTYDYAKPFFELFRVIHLEGLNRQDTVTLLLKLGEHYREESIQRITGEEPGRVEALRRLTGGVPRTMVLLFEIFIDHENGKAFQDLEVILDRVTPLYKHRMDDLSPQQQKIVDTIALNWDAVSTGEIAQKTRMESKAVSSHLKILERSHLIHKIGTDTRNYLYQVTERFFNIWYLMRHGRGRGINRVQWLVNFLEAWCGDTELSQRAQEHIRALKTGEVYSRYAFYLTEALARTHLPMDLQHDLIGRTREFLEKKDKSLLKELSPSDNELLTEAIKCLMKKDFAGALAKLEAIRDKRGEIFSLIAFIHDTGYNDFQKVEEYYLLAVEKGNADAMNNLAWMYFSLKQNKTRALSLIREAVQKEKNTLTLHNLSLILLWNDEIEESLKVERELMENEEYIDKSIATGSEYLILLMAKKQYYAALKLFTESPFDLQERIKPVYYALMYFLKENYPNEYKKMGDELKETVEEIIAKVHLWEKDYS